MKDRRNTVGRVAMKLRKRDVRPRSRIGGGERRIERGWWGLKKTEGRLRLSYMYGDIWACINRRRRMDERLRHSECPRGCNCRHWFLRKPRQTNESRGGACPVRRLSVPLILQTMPKIKQYGVGPFMDLETNWRRLNHSQKD